MLLHVCMKLYLWTDLMFSFAPAPDWPKIVSQNQHICFFLIYFDERNNIPIRWDTWEGWSLTSFSVEKQTCFLAIAEDFQLKGLTGKAVLKIGESGEHQRYAKSLSGSPDWDEQIISNELDIGTVALTKDLQEDIIYYLLNRENPKKERCPINRKPLYSCKNMWERGRKWNYEASHWSRSYGKDFLSL